MLVVADVVWNDGNNQKRRKMRVKIIGAGVIGLYLAWKLAAKGHSVDVYEKNKVGHKTCSGLVSNRILKFIPSCSNLPKREVIGVLVDDKVKLKFRRKHYVFDRGSLDNMLCTLARSNGATVHESSLVEKIPDDCVVIGCDGSGSLVRKSIGLDKLNYRSAARGVAGYTTDRNYAKVWRTANGFTWELPRTDGVEYGIIGDGVPALLDFARNRKVHLDEVQASAIPRQMSVGYKDKVTVCGDAAGTNKPWSGGGIIWGLTASDILLEHIPNFKLYVRNTQRRFRAEIVFSRAGMKISSLLTGKHNLIFDGDFILGSRFIG